MEDRGFDEEDAIMRQYTWTNIGNMVKASGMLGGQKNASPTINCPFPLSFQADPNLIWAKRTHKPQGSMSRRASAAFRLANFHCKEIRAETRALDGLIQGALWCRLQELCTHQSPASF
uniref:Uncharacterized protein n=1 Tax=Salix viminalis TaxID=40686 RepID=A0A6N2KYR7_SALVM